MSFLQIRRGMTYIIGFNQMFSQLQTLVECWITNRIIFISTKVLTEQRFLVICGKGENNSAVNSPRPSGTYMRPAITGSDKDLWPVRYYALSESILDYC